MGKKARQRETPCEFLPGRPYHREYNAGDYLKAVEIASFIGGADGTSSLRLVVGVEAGQWSIQI